MRADRWRRASRGGDALPDARRAAAAGHVHRRDRRASARTSTRARRSSRCSATRSRSGAPTASSSSSSSTRTTATACCGRSPRRTRRAIGSHPSTACSRGTARSSGFGTSRVTVRDEHGRAALRPGLPARHHRAQARRRRSARRLVSAARGAERAAARARPDEGRVRRARLARAADAAHVDPRLPRARPRRGGRRADRRPARTSSRSSSGTRSACCASSATCSSSPRSRPASWRSTASTSTSSRLARDCVEAARPRAAEKAIELSLDAGEPRADLEGDRTRLAQLLDNLVSNAIKFTPERADGSTSGSSVGNGASCVVTVSDTGIGHPRGRAGAASSSASSARRARPQRAIQGTGLGLTITKAIAEAHGGVDRGRERAGDGNDLHRRAPRRAGRSSRADA